MTMIELLVILAVLAILVVSLVPRLVREKRKAQRIHCTNNLKQVGLLFNAWAGPHQGYYPSFFDETNGSSINFDSGPNAWRHFRIPLNPLTAPKILFCPAESDDRRSIATNFTAFNNSNVSYFVGLAANRSVHEKFLAGDRNITNGTVPTDGILKLTANQPGGWTLELHKGIGNLLLTDGSVQQLSRSGLQEAVTSADAATNRLLLPILPP